MLNFTICILFLFFWQICIYIRKRKNCCIATSCQFWSTCFEEKELCRGLEMHRSINELMISQMIELKRFKFNKPLPWSCIETSTEDKENHIFVHRACWPYNCVTCAFALSIVNLVDKWKGDRRNTWSSSCKALPTISFFFFAQKEEK